MLRFNYFFTPQPDQTHFFLTHCHRILHFYTLLHNKFSYIRYTEWHFDVNSRETACWVPLKCMRRLAMQFKVNEALKIFKGEEERLRYFGQEPVWRCCVLIIESANDGGKNLYFRLLMSRNAHGMSRFLVSRFGDCTRRKRLSVMNMQTFVLHQHRNLIPLVDCQI